MSVNIQLQTVCYFAPLHTQILNTIQKDEISYISQSEWIIGMPIKTSRSYLFIDHHHHEEKMYITIFQNHYFKNMIRYKDKAHGMILPHHR